MYQDSYREDNVYSVYRKYNFGTCLILGLGELELIPKWIKENYPKCLVEVVEIDKNKKSNLSYTVHYQDAFSFTPVKTYDLIIVDIWYAGSPGYRREIEVLKIKYYSYLNEGGIMSFPMVDMHTIYTYVELQRRVNWLSRANA